MPAENKVTKEEWEKYTYNEGLPENYGPFRDLLEGYSKIPADEVDEHLLSIRDKAWAVSRYPCIGRWAFTKLDIIDEPTFQSVIARLKAPESQDAFLDVACCLGQMVRKLAAEGIDPAKLNGTDRSAAFLDLGFELFRDRDRFPDDAFVAADLLGPSGAGVKTLEGKVTLIHVSNLFHLFLWEDQVAAASRIVSFLRPGAKESIIFGGQVGCPDREQAQSNPRVYLHDLESLKKFWVEVGEKTGVKLKVDTEWGKKVPMRVPTFPEDCVYIKFVVHIENRESGSVGDGYTANFISKHASTS